MSAKGVGALFRQENVSFHYFFFKCLEYNEMKEYAKQFSNIFVRVFAKTWLLKWLVTQNLNFL